MKKILVITSAIILLAAACNKQAAIQPAQNQTNQNLQNTSMITISSPIVGETYNKQVRIQGKTSPNSEIFGFASVNTLPDCINTSIGPWAEGKADANGTFDIPLDYHSNKSGKVLLVLSSFSKTPGLSEGCFPKSNLSEVIEFTYIGPVLKQPIQ